MPDREGPMGSITCVSGETFVVSEPDGQLRPQTHDGLYRRDLRLLDRLILTVDGVEPVPLARGNPSSSTATFHGHVLTPDPPSPDPTVLFRRERRVGGGWHEGLAFDNRSGSTRTIMAAFELGTDFAHIFDVRHDRPQAPVPCKEERPGEVVFRRPGGAEQVKVVTTPPAEVVDGRLEVRLEVPARSEARICLLVTIEDEEGTHEPPPCPLEDLPVESVPADAPRPIEFWCSDPRITRLLRLGLADVDSLAVRDPLDPRDRFCLAGSPWFLTLFGRDAIWTARMALPFDVDLAAGTLRALARRQGQRKDLDREEEPGKILHEVRYGALRDRADLPDTYYGSIDATPLWIILLHEAWCWGMPEADVAALLPNLEGALAWIEQCGDPTGDGFLKYVRHGERGLVNQGWKDSHDGIQFADGTLAVAPIALSEVQGYAHQAARAAAELLAAFDRPDHHHWTAWADRLRDRFRAAFWIDDDLGRFPAIALDKDGRPVDAPASNMGHLLASGLLDEQDVRDVAARLGHPSMSSGWGLRTMATTAVGYNPLSYHCGSVWPHDTAIAMAGCAKHGHRDVARELMMGLVRAAPHFRYRLPELFAGHPRREVGFPVPYPGACRPQAWAAGAALLMVEACLGFSPRIQDRTLTLRPPWPALVERLDLHGLRVGGATLDVHLSAGSGLDVEVVQGDLQVITQRVHR